MMKLSRSRTAPTREVERAKVLIVYRRDQCFTRYISMDKFDTG
ncbi:hypothetical protein RP726_14020 [Candidatus Methylospira mobilis]|nr:hypothetical protein [Candidatus Methylospira mobilis]WNV03557.1 hypothetical protein RP726_14020 [Candidatus Methylospira mobilis]